MIPFLSVTAAVSFRAFLGGEKRINDYCHLLAISGGKRLQELFSAGGKEMIFMENDQQELTANMVRSSSPFSCDAVKLTSIQPSLAGQRRTSYFSDRHLGPQGRSGVH